jgi:hypothetical protein
LHEVHPGMISTRAALGEAPFKRMNATIWSKKLFDPAL